VQQMATLQVREGTGARERRARVARGARGARGRA
jgi:hypothetical protein